MWTILIYETVWNVTYYLHRRTSCYRWLLSQGRCSYTITRRLSYCRTVRSWLMIQRLLAASIRSCWIAAGSNTDYRSRHRIFILHFFPEFFIPFQRSWNGVLCHIPACGSTSARVRLCVRHEKSPENKRLDLAVSFFGRLMHADKIRFPTSF